MGVLFYTIAVAEDVQNQHTAELSRDGKAYEVFLENPKKGNTVRRFDLAGDAVEAFATLAHEFAKGRCTWEECVQILMAREAATYEEEDDGDSEAIGPGMY